MQMVRICVCHTYADAQHMDMVNISSFIYFSGQIRKKVVPDLHSIHRHTAAPAGHILWSLSLSRRCDTPCIVLRPHTGTRPLHTGKRRFAYSVCVVHFRKIVIRQKVGSHRNGHPVIYRRVYMTAYYHPENEDGLGKSSG